MEFRKYFRDCVTAVDKVSFEIVENQITVLLGHNGAGKTTTMSMICGFIQPTSGTIAVDGEPKMLNYRHKIGYCPQHNIYLPFLTCKQHLTFFGMVSAFCFLRSNFESLECGECLFLSVTRAEKKYSQTSIECATRNVGHLDESNAFRTYAVGRHEASDVPGQCYRWEHKVR